jgi:metal-responsive CopG/Arc/MetJ family transcriptional regulator
MVNNKKVRKVKVFFTIDPDLYSEFEKHIDDKLLDKSKLIEFLIREYMDSEKINKN